MDISTTELKDLQGIILSLLQQKQSNNTVRRIDNMLEDGYTIAIYDVGDILRIDIKRGKKSDS